MPGPVHPQDAARLLHLYHHLLLSRPLLPLMQTLHLSPRSVSVSNPPRKTHPTAIPFRPSGRFCLFPPFCPRRQLLPLMVFQSQKTSQSGHRPSSLPQNQGIRPHSLPEIRVCRRAYQQRQELYHLELKDKRYRHHPAHLQPLLPPVKW